jgi:hypothetical protein
MTGMWIDVDCLRWILGCLEEIARFAVLCLKDKVLAFASPLWAWC